MVSLRATEIHVEIKQLIAEALGYSFKKVVQPTQNLTNLQTMLAKPGVGSRSISKTPVLYRLSLRVRHEVPNWETNMTGDFDTAGKGRSALIAAVYSYTAEQVIGVSHDMAKIFDTMDISILINKSVELGASRLKVF